MQTPVLIVPGIGNSGHEHWQSRWQQRHPEFVRLEVDDWDQPVCADWVAAIERSVSVLGPSTVIAAHSLGCLAVAHWAAQTQAAIGGALLVAVPDPHGPNFPGAARGFAPLPEQPFAFASTIVASDDDPYGSAAHAQRYAQAWGSSLHRAGKLGHINSASGLGDWDAGLALFNALRAGRAPVSAA